MALAAEVPRFSTHTTRHLCLTDLARAGWEVHAIATFAGHRSTDSTLRYVNSRELHQAGEKPQVARLVRCPAGSSEALILAA
ncbi:MAG: tyrosine-type recombinase/integrase [Streptosporangiaceae bacterium]